MAFLWLRLNRTNFIHDFEKNKRIKRKNRNENQSFLIYHSCLRGVTKNSYQGPNEFLSAYFKLRLPWCQCAAATFDSER
jgi:hypothetical protein